MKDVENRSQNGSTELDYFSIGVPAVNVPESLSLSSASNVGDCSQQVLAWLACSPSPISKASLSIAISWETLSAAEAEEPLLATPPFLRWTKAYRPAIVSVKLYSVLTAVEKHAICYCFSKQIKPKTEVKHKRQLRKELAKIVVDRMLPHEKLSSRDVIGRCASARPNFAGPQLRRSFSLDPVVWQREGLGHFESIG